MDNEQIIKGDLKMKKVIDFYSKKEVIVDEQTAKITSFDNAKRVIKYSAEIIEYGKNTGFWADFEEVGTVNDIDVKLNTCFNPIKFYYACKVNFNSNKNDPKGELWVEICEAVKQNPDKFFYKNGNFKRNSLFKNW